MSVEEVAKSGVAAGVKRHPGFRRLPTNAALYLSKASEGSIAANPDNASTFTSWLKKVLRSEPMDIPPLEAVTPLRRSNLSETASITTGFCFVLRIQNKPFYPGPLLLPLVVTPGPFPLPPTGQPSFRSNMCNVK